MTIRRVNKLTRDQTILETIQNEIDKKYPHKIQKNFFENPELSCKLINEFCQLFAFKCDYIEEQSNDFGIFTFTVQINKEELATGSGKSKKAAKNEAARLALNLIFDQTSNFTLSQVPGQINYDGSGHSVVMKVPTLKLDETIESVTFDKNKISKEELLHNGVDKFIKFCHQNNEGYQVLVHRVQENNNKMDIHSSQVNLVYIVQFYFDNICIGSGSDESLQNAYSLAGYAANKNISDEINEIHMSSINGPSLEPPKSRSPSHEGDQSNLKNQLNDAINQKFPDNDIGKAKSLLLNYLKQLSTYIKNEFSENEISISHSIAAFFVKSHFGMKLVAFGSGTGFCESKYLSIDGKTINNSHALVLARRSFKRYLLNEIIKFSDSNKDKSLDILRFDGNKFYLKEDVEFIFLMTKSPCGDTTATGTTSKGCLHHLLPTKNDSKTSNNDIWDEMSDNIFEPTDTTGQGSTFQSNQNAICQSFNECFNKAMLRMSCTDKLTLWNILGFQGSLINMLLEAIYIPLIVVCSNGDDQTEYLQWTTHQKLNPEFSSGEFDLPGEFIPFEPEYVQTDNPFESFIDASFPKKDNIEINNKNQPFSNQKNNDDDESFAINWYYPAQAPEIINTSKGTIYQSLKKSNVSPNQYYNDEPSRLCKVALLFYFQKALKNSNIKLAGYDQSMNYTDSKEFNRDYLMAKSKFYEILAKTSFGKWIKHLEFGQFSIKH